MKICRIFIVILLSLTVISCGLESSAASNNDIKDDIENIYIINGDIDNNVSRIMSRAFRIDLDRLFSYNITLLTPKTACEALALAKHHSQEKTYTPVILVISTPVLSNALKTDCMKTDLRESSLLYMYLDEKNDNVITGGFLVSKHQDIDNYIRLAFHIMFKGKGMKSHDQFLENDFMWEKPYEERVELFFDSLAYWMNR